MSAPASVAPAASIIAPSRRCLGILLPTLLLGIFAAHCLWFAGTQSLTFDEPIHLVAGQAMWRHGSFQLWNDHPPLARLLVTLPLIGPEWQIQTVSAGDMPRVTAVRPGPQPLARRARCMNVLLGLALGWLLWVAARSLLSEGAALFALALFAFSPGMTAHFSLATTDGAGVLFVFAAAFQLARWRRHPTWLQTVLLGATLGLMLLAKFYTLPLFALALLLVLLVDARAENRWGRFHWRAAALSALLALMLLWAGYFFHVSRLTVTDGRLVATFPNREPLIKDLRSRLNLSLLVPAGEYIDGLRSVKYHNRIGHPAFLMGDVSHRGFRSYWPVAVALKWPIIVLLLFLAALALAALRRLTLPRDLWLMALFPLLFLLLAARANIQIGDRHLLPAYPFLLLFAASLWHATRRRALKIVLISAVLLQAADAARYAPDYLSYFNVFVRPAQSYKLLTDSNLDWGQGLIALREYQRVHGNEPLHLAYFGIIDPAVYGIRYTPLAPGDRPCGAVVVSATHLSGQYLPDPAAYRWLEQYPRTIVNHSLHVFRVPCAD